MPRLVFLIALICFFLHGNAVAKMLNVEADDVLKVGQRIEAYGNVVVTGEDLTLKADYVVYDISTEDIWATGDCTMREAKGEVNAATLSYNAKRKDLHIQNGTILSYDQAMKISGESITRYGEDYITGQSIEFTHCLGTPPDWSIAADELEIPVGGYGNAQDARFKVRSWPLLRIPYLLFPADLSRHSGLLIPELSHGSDYGYRFGLPAFITLGRSLDWTVTPTWLSSRGLLMKNELRYSMDYDQNGLIYLETLHDKLGGEKSNGGVLQTIPEDRWFLKADKGGNNLNWDINLVSNVDYFRDIGTFYDPKYLKDSTPGGEVNQLDDSNLTELISRLQWVNSYKGVSLALSSQWKQDLTQKDNGMTIQELPKITARLREKNIPYTPLQVSAEVDSIRIYTLDSIQAFKDNAQTEISWPLTVFPYFTFRPYVKELYRDTLFSETKDLYPDSTYQEHWEERGASLSTTLYGPRFAGGLYHQVIPEISWEHFSRIGGNDNLLDPNDTFPQLLTGDDWAKTVNMDLSLSNYLRNAQGSSLADLGVDCYYSYLTNQWNDINVRANLYPFSWLSASHTNTFSRVPGSPYATSEHSTRLSLTDTRGDVFTFGEEYYRPDTKLITTGVQAMLMKGLTAGCEVKFNFIDHKFDNQTQTIGYNSQCWAVIVERQVVAQGNTTPRKTTWSLNVKLLGMGDILRQGKSNTGATQR
jgi:hypothetical protein